MIIVSEYPGLLKWICLPMLICSPLFMYLDYKRGFISDSIDVGWLSILLLHVLGLLYFNRTKIVLNDSTITKKRLIGQVRIRINDIREIRVRAANRGNYMTTTISSLNKAIKFDSYMRSYNELNRILSERCRNAIKIVG